MRFCIVVGRPYGTGTLASIEHRMQVALRDAVTDHLTRRKLDLPTAVRAGELAVADKLARPGVETVYLMPSDVARYVMAAQQRLAS